MKLSSSVASLALVCSVVVSSGQQASTVRQTVTTIAEGKTVSVKTHQVRLIRKSAPSGKPHTDSTATRVFLPEKGVVTAGAKKVRPNVFPGYPNVTINSQSFSNVPVGGTPQSLTLTYPFPSGATALYANFANGLDFSGADSVCTSTGCSATFTFNPRYPGLARDAIVIVDQNNNPVYETLLYGTGTAPQFGYDLGDLTVDTGLTNQPGSIAIGPDGDLYLVDASENMVYKIQPGFSSSENLNIVELGTPGGIAVDGDNTVYVADKTNNVIVAYNEKNGAQTTVATSTLSNPSGLAVNGAGLLFIADTGNGRIIVIDTQGGETTLLSGINSPTSIALDAAGDVFYVDAGNGGEVMELPVEGSLTTIASQQGTLYDIAVDAGGRLYIATPSGDTLISPDGSMREYGGGENYGIAVDLAGNVYTTQPESGSIAVTNRSISNFILSTEVDTTTTGGDTISNTGNMPLTLSSIAISGTVFTNDPSSQCVAGLTVQPGQACHTAVDFAPTAAQSYTESYTVTSNSLNVTTTTDVDTLYGYGTGVPTTTTLSISPNPVMTGQTVEFIATVMRTGTGPSGVTNGSMNFYDGTTLLGTVSQSNGAAYAMYFTSTLAAGTHSITAMYSGDTINASSTSAAQNVLVTAGDTSSTTLASTPASPIQGQKVTFTVAVSGAPGVSVPTGTVTLTNTSVSPAMLLGTVTIDGNGQGSFSTNQLATGSYSVLATYNGDANYNPSESAADAFTVSPPPTTTTVLTASPATVAYEGVVTLSANVYVEDNVTSGQVIFCDAAAAFCTATQNLGLAQIAGNGTAVLRLGSGTIGTHNYTATYLGMIGYASSTSTAQSVTVTGTYPTTTTIAETGSAGSYSLTGTVVGLGTNLLNPTGTVSFLDASNGNASLGSGALGASAVNFSQVQAAGSPLATGQLPYGVATGDFNGDGFLDLAVANGSSSNVTSSTVSILLGNGDGTFRASVTYPAGSDTVNVAIADVNGDGFADLVLSDVGGTTGSVNVLLGNGDGTFQAFTSYPCQSPQALGLLDLNHDGFPDIVTGNEGANTINVLLGNGDGTFQTVVTYPAGNYPDYVTEADFNGDGNVDIATSNDQDGTVSVLLGNGDGTFKSQVTYAAGSGPLGIQAADVNGDGIVDLAVANGNENTISVLLGNGDGTFATQVTYGAGQAPQSLTIADFNGDGFPDITVISLGADTESVLLGNGDGTFAAPLTYPTAGTTPIGVTTGDFNGDGLPDVAETNTDNGTTGIFLSQVTQTAMTPVTNVTVGGGANAVHNVEASYPGDTNFGSSMSQTTPLAGGVTAVASATTLTIAPTASTVGQNVIFSVSVAGTTQSTPVPTGTVTLTNNHVTPAATLGTITLSGGTGTFSTSTLAAGSYSVTATYSGDGNYAASTSGADAFTVTAPAVTTTNLTVTPTSGALGTVFTLRATVVDGNGNPVTGGMVNFLDNGKLLATAELVSATGAMTGTATYETRSFTLGNHALTATFAGTHFDVASTTMAAVTISVTGKYTTASALASTGVQGSYALTATVNGFGFGPTGSVVFTDTSTNATLGTLPLSGVVQSFVPGGPISAGSSATQVVSADVNGDGKLDLVVANGSGTMVTVLLGNGDGTYTVMSSFGTNYDGISSVAVADFNGDGKLDIATANQSTVGIFLGNGDGTFGAEQDFANTNTSAGVFPGDFNGDGKLDLAVPDRFSGMTILIGNGDGTFTQPNPASDAGASPNYHSAIADFNGDGILDIATGNFFANTVSILIGNGDGTFQAPVTYATGATPTATFAGDFNGDGFQDIFLTNSAGASISVLLGNGDGTFQPQQTYAVGSDPADASVGDVNGDGKLDIAVANVNDGTVSILLGNGDGTFQTQQVLTSGNGTQSVTIGDANGDGTRDIEAANAGSNTVTVFLNQTVAAISLTGVTLPGTGADSVVATYSGDSSFAGSTSNTLTLPSNLVGMTTTNLAMTPAFPTVGQNITFSAVVAGAKQSTTAPTGTVTLTNTNVTPAVTLGTITLSGGAGTLSTSSLAVGSYSVTAVYGGDANYAASTSSADTFTVSAPVATATPATNTTLTANLATVVSGGTVTLTATVAIGTTPVAPGQVLFCDAGTPTCSGSHLLATVQLNAAGTATYKFVPGIGTHSYQAVFLGTNTVGGSASGPAAVVVTGKYPTTTTIAQSGTAGNYTLNAMTIGASPYPTQITTQTITINLGQSAQNYVLTGTGPSTVQGATYGNFYNTQGACVAAGPTTTACDLTGSFTSSTSTFAAGTYDFQTVFSGSVSSAIVSQTGSPVVENEPNEFESFYYSAFAPSTAMTLKLNVTGGGSYSIPVAINGNFAPNLDNVNFAETSPVCGGTSLGEEPCQLDYVGVVAGATYSSPITGAVQFEMPNPSSALPTGPTGTVSFLDTSNANAVLDTAALGTGTPGFTLAQPAGSPVAVGSGAYGVATGDFNGDGFQDIVVENYEANSVSVLLGKGDGTFQPQVTYPVGEDPERVLVADLNGDGNLDLIVANTGSGSISVLLGKGDGTFQEQETFSAASPVGLAVMDINHDGYPDVVAGDYYAATMSVLLGNGDGTLQAAVTYPTGGTPQTVAEGDFNGDGNVDVVVGNLSDGTAGVFLGNGDGTFQPMVTYPVGSQPMGVQVGDFNEDGRPDLAVSNSGANTISVLLGNGDGTFATQVTYPVGADPVGLVIADFNGDGHQDLSVGNTAKSALTQSVLLGKGDGTFQPQLTFPAGNFPYGEAVADFNGDGLPDMAVANFSDATTTIFLSQLTQTATASASVTIGGSSATTHTVLASYPGDVNFAASVSATTSLNGGGVAAMAPALTSISPAGGVTGSPATTVTLTGTNFATTDVVEIGETALSTTFLNATTLTAVIPASFFATAGALPVSVMDSAGGLESGTVNFVVLVAPAVVFTGPSTASSGQQPVVTFQLVQPYSVPIDGILTLTFTPSTPAGIVDPAVQFSSGGTTIAFTIPAGSTATPPVQFQTGTVAGTVTITLTITDENADPLTPTNVAPVVVVLPATVPVIMNASMSQTDSALTVTMQGFSNTREVKTAIFHFTGTPGTVLTTPDVTIDVTPVFGQWFGSGTSTQYGSTFTYTQPFNLDDPSSIIGVTVTLVNSVGDSEVSNAP